MFSGIATRMAYALQLHRELDHDPLGQKHGKATELSFTDREIRRRTMWSCFLMDRFNSSGTERPMFADEDKIKVQLPIRESNFQMEISGPTESLDGRVPNPIVNSDIGSSADPLKNMGVAAYMIRIIALWGRVINYLNMGGKEKDPKPMWDPRSRYAELRVEATNFRASLPSELRNTPENLKTHASEKLGNQFLFLHIAIHQVILFLNRFAIPTAPGARNPKEMPNSFLEEAGPLAVEAANGISSLIKYAWDYHAVAPFLGYCAFLSSTVHVWAKFSKSQAIAETSSMHLATNMNYLKKMKDYWGTFQFMIQNLRDIYLQHADASKKDSGEKQAQDNKIFQYGDWFGHYPHGAEKKDEVVSPIQVKHESNDTALDHKPDLQTVENFIQTQSPPSHTTEFKQPIKKHPRIRSQPDDHQQQNRQSETQSIQQDMAPLQMSDSQAPMDPSAFVGQHPTQLYPSPCSNSFPQNYDLLPMPTAANSALLPQLDRQLVYGAYAGHNPTGSSSASALSAMTNGQQESTGVLSDTSSQMWHNPLNIPPHEQQQMLGSGAGYLGEIPTSAWFMPFNLNPNQTPGDNEDLLQGFR